jgi:hypothetical protein
MSERVKNAGSGTARAAQSPDGQAFPTANVQKADKSRPNAAARGELVGHDQQQALSRSISFAT